MKNKEIADNDAHFNLEEAQRKKVFCYFGRLFSVQHFIPKIFIINLADNPNKKVIKTYLFKVASSYFVQDFYLKYYSGDLFVCHIFHCN